MHRPYLRFLILALLLILLGTGGAFLAMEKAYPPLPQTSDGGCRMDLAVLPQGETEFPQLDVRFLWDPADLPTLSLLLSDVEHPTVQTRCFAHTVRITADGTALRAELEPRFGAQEEGWEHVGFNCRATFLPATILRMPDGGVHPQYHLLLEQDMSFRAPFQKEEHALALTELVIDPLDGTVDVVLPDIPQEKRKTMPQVTAIAHAQHDPQLPARFCGTETEQRLQRYLFLVVSMHHAESTRRLLPSVIARGEKLMETDCAPDKPFPECWGDAQETALANHRRILPYLRRLQALDCFGIPELADFINSPLFGRLFGESWN